jgi:uncharacterized membrane protein
VGFAYFYNILTQKLTAMAVLTTPLLIIHIIAGFTALLTGIVALATQKGGSKHRIAGLGFFWAMVGILITALALATIRPNVFLFLVGVFSFYMAFTGYRIMHIGKTAKGQAPAWPDKLVSGITLMAGLFMLFCGFANISTFTFALQPLFIIFGCVTIGFSFSDLLRYHRGMAHKNAWLILHIGRMCGAFIATVTAFLVVNVTFLPALVVWVGPGVIGSIFITFWIRKYKAKWQKSATSKVVRA